jgi:hypothetical protein
MDIDMHRDMDMDMDMEMDMGMGIDYGYGCARGGAHVPMHVHILTPSCSYFMVAASDECACAGWE